MFKKAQRTLVLSGPLLGRPQTVYMVIPRAAIAGKGTFGDLKVSGGFGADALTAMAFELDSIIDLLEVVAFKC